MSINPFQATGLFRYPLKTSENQKFSYVFGGIKSGITWVKEITKVKSFCKVLISDEEKEIKLNVYFQTSLSRLKRFNEGLEGLHKTF